MIGGITGAAIDRKQKGPPSRPPGEPPPPWVVIFLAFALVVVVVVATILTPLEAQAPQIIQATGSTQESPSQ